jgi:SOS response regulatory protein OraA/RecX
MSAPTLDEVLAALDDPNNLDDAVLAACWMRANREALGQWEWRRKMRTELTLQHGELIDRKFRDGLSDEEAEHLEQVRDVLDQLDETLVIPEDWRPEVKG